MNVAMRSLRSSVISGTPTTSQARPPRVVRRGPDGLLRSG